MKNSKMYKEVNQQHNLHKNSIKNCIIAFISGGFLGLLAQFVYVFLLETLGLNDIMASNIIVLIVIILTSLATGLGFYDKLAQHCGAGLFIPISGFANALTSCALEFKTEGLIFGIGSNMFKYAGSVITYGIVSVYIFGLIRYFLNI